MSKNNDSFKSFTSGFFLSIGQYVVVQPPAVPYFVEPGIAFGSKPVIIKEITVLLYSLRVLTF